MEESPIGLDKWMPVLWLIANCRNGISSWEIHRDLGVTQKTAWFMLQRVRLAMQDDLNDGTMDGEDEERKSFIGITTLQVGKVRALKGKRGHSGKKTILMGMLELASKR